MGDTVQRVLDLLAAEQGADHADIFGEGLNGGRPLPHGPHGRVASADPHKGAARRQAGRGGDTVGRHGRQTQAGHGDARADPDGLGLLGNQRQNGPGVGADHLAVGHPTEVIAKIFRMPDKADLVNLGATDPEIHQMVLLRSRTLP